MKSGIQPSQIVSCEAPAPYARHMVLTLKLATLALVMAAQSLVADIIRDFAQPPPKYRPTSLYWLNNNIENPVIDLQLPRFRDKDGYGSVAILPVAENGPGRNSSANTVTCSTNSTSWSGCSIPSERPAHRAAWYNESAAHFWAAFKRRRT